MFQKNHYEKVARTLKEARQSQLVSVSPDTTSVWTNTMVHFSAMFRRDNVAFDVNRFEQACLEN